MSKRLGYVQLEGAKRPNRLVFGLDWVPLDNLLSHHEQIQVWRERGFAWSVSYRQNKQTQLGLASTDDALESVATKGLAISGAALLASLPGIKGGSGLYILSTQGEQGSVYAIGLIRGRIIIDAVISERDVVTVRSDYQHECNKAGINAVFVGIDGQQQITGQLDQCISWDALIKARKWFKSAALQPLKSERLGWVLLSLTIIVVAVVTGTWFWRDHEQQLLQKRQALQAWATDPVVLYQQAIEKVMKDPDAVLTLASALDDLVPWLGKLQSQRGGWQLDGINCVIADSTCTASWGLLDGKLGSFKSFAQASPALSADWKVQLGTEMDKLQVLMPLAAVRTHAPNKLSVPTLQEFLANQTWQNYAVLGVQVTMQAPMAQHVPQNVPTHVAQHATDGLWASTWTVAGAPWWAVEALRPKDKVDPATVTLDKLTLSIMGKETKFSAEGKVYVRKP